MVMPPPRFPFRRDNFKNILVRPFKFGMWVYMGNAVNAIVLLPCPSICPVLIYRKLDHPMGGIYNTYICPL